MDVRTSNNVFLTIAYLVEWWNFDQRGKQSIVRTLRCRDGTRSMQIFRKSPADHNEIKDILRLVVHMY